MKAILICPSERSEVSLLSVKAPLASAPACGFGVAEYWMGHLACVGMKEVTLLANDRPEEVRWSGWPTPSESTNVNFWYFEPRFQPSGPLVID